MNFKDKESAFSFGYNMQLLMRDPSIWEIDVWENMGWHVGLYFKNVSVYPGTGNETTVEKAWYHTLISPNLPEEGRARGGGLAVWTKDNIADTPQRSVDMAVADVMECVNDLCQAAFQAHKAVEPKDKSTENAWPKRRPPRK
jgi:hypothetical protein